MSNPYLEAAKRLKLLSKTPDPRKEVPTELEHFFGLKPNKTVGGGPNYFITTKGNK